MNIKSKNPWNNKNPWRGENQHKQRVKVVTSQKQNQREPAHFIQKYDPLIHYLNGQTVIPPDQLYSDGGIRREPSFEHKQPGITSICRGFMFAPKLRVGDKIIYVTKKKPDRKIVCALEIIHTFPSHTAAATYYQNNNLLPLPVNCCVAGNAFRLPGNGGSNPPHTDNFYLQKRVIPYPVFHVCKKIKENLVQPNTIQDKVINKILGVNYDNYQNQKKITKLQFAKLVKLI
jgi:hypothetical protein